MEYATLSAQEIMSGNREQALQLIQAYNEHVSGIYTMEGCSVEDLVKEEIITFDQAEPTPGARHWLPIDEFLYSHKYGPQTTVNIHFDIAKFICQYATPEYDIVEIDWGDEYPCVDKEKLVEYILTNYGDYIFDYGKWLSDLFITRLDGKYYEVLFEIDVEGNANPVRNSQYSKERYNEIFVFDNENK